MIKIVIKKEENKKEVINSDDEKGKKYRRGERNKKRGLKGGEKGAERRGKQRPRPPTYRVLQEQMFPSSTEFRHRLIDS